MQCSSEQLFSLNPVSIHLSTALSISHGHLAVPILFQVSLIAVRFFTIDMYSTKRE